MNYFELVNIQADMDKMEAEGRVSEEKSQRGMIDAAQAA